MKIMMTIYSLNLGGAERVLAMMANYLVHKQYDVCLVTLSNEKPFYALDSLVKLIQLGVNEEVLESNNAILNNITRIKALSDIIKYEKPDIVISFMTTTNILAILAAKLTKKPIIVSEHSNYYFLNSKIWRFLRRIVYPLSDALIVLTDHDKKKYDYHSNTHVIQNPLVIENKHKNIQRKKIILAVGRLEHEKGFDLLLKAFSQLKSNDWQLVILGEGSERPRLEKQARELKIDKKVFMPGSVRDVEEYYKKASIFVLSSRMEGFPVALCEAMGYGCASVAFDCLTGPSDIIKNKENGILIEAENTNKLFKSIQYLIDQPVKREELAGNAKTIVNELNIETIAMKWIEIINNNK